MIGKIVYQGQDGYQETVECESGNTRLIDCSGGGGYPLLRLEWTDTRGYDQNAAFYSWPAAVANFERRAAGM